MAKRGRNKSVLAMESICVRTSKTQTFVRGRGAPQIPCARDDKGEGGASMENWLVAERIVGRAPTPGGRVARGKENRRSPAALPRHAGAGGMTILWDHERLFVRPLLGLSSL
jgi:hypothetical protein